MKKIVPLSKVELFEYINSMIEPKTWLKDEHKYSKEVDLDPTWNKLALDIVWQYRNAGWHVLYYVHGDRHYFHFANPNYRRFNDGKV